MILFHALYHVWYGSRLVVHKIHKSSCSTKIDPQSADSSRPGAVASCRRRSAASWSGGGGGVARGRRGQRGRSRAAVRYDRAGPGTRSGVGCRKDEAPRRGEGSGPAGAESVGSPPVCALDASALLALLNSEPGSMSGMCAWRIVGGVTREAGLSLAHRARFALARDSASRP